MIHKNSKVDKIKSYQGEDKRGDILYKTKQVVIMGTGQQSQVVELIDVDCRWTENSQVVFDSEGKETNSEVQVLFEPWLDLLKPLSVIKKDKLEYIVIKSHYIQGLVGRRALKVYLKGGHPIG